MTRWLCKKDQYWSRSAQRDAKTWTPAFCLPFHHQVRRIMFHLYLFHDSFLRLLLFSFHNSLRACLAHTRTGKGEKPATRQMFTALPLKVGPHTLPSVLIGWTIGTRRHQTPNPRVMHVAGRNRCFFFYLVVGQLARRNSATDAALDSYKYFIYLFILIIPQNHYFLCIFSFFSLFIGALDLKLMLAKLHINSSRISIFFLYE